MGEWLSSVFSDFTDMKGVTIGVILGLVVLGLLLIPARRKFNVRMLVFGAMCVAIAFLLSYIRIYRMPQGGSVTPASMLPIMMFAYIFGPLPGLMVSVVYGMLQLLQDFFVMHPVSLLLDYVFAFGCLCLAGIFRNKPYPFFFAGAVIAGLGRFICHVISGVVFYASYAPEGMHPLVYSLNYNLSVIGPDLAICLAIMIIPQMKSVIQRLKNEQLRTEISGARRIQKQSSAN